VSRCPCRSSFPTGGSLAACMQGVLAQELRWQLLDKEQGHEEGPASNAATAAKIVYLATTALVALTQIQQLLLGDEVPLRPPIALPPAAPGAGTAATAEVVEGSHIMLSHRLGCMVAFARGQERKVYFAVEGLPSYVGVGAPPAAANGRSPLPSTASSPTATKGESAPASAAVGALTGASPAPGGSSSNSNGMAERLACVPAEALAAAAAVAAPVVVVADPGSRPNTGVVLSTAPLLGACPRVDNGHPKWLHVRVRPQARALLRVLAASNPGTALLNCERQLVSGHWVLAFPSADEAKAALQLVEQSAHGMRELHRQVLLPMLGPQAAG
jgi:hypothetical protein